MRGFYRRALPGRSGFPFLFGGTFIEGPERGAGTTAAPRFPFLFGGTFIEGETEDAESQPEAHISLPFRRDFH